MAVNYKFLDEKLGTTPIGNGDTSAQVELGYIALAKDATYGIGEFMYVKFSGTVAAGDLVVFDPQAGTCVQSPTAATKGYFGIAMAAQTANTYGWVLIRGTHDAANVLTGSTLQVAPNYGSALTAGRITSAVTANYILDGVAIKASGASNVGTVYLYWPTCSGR